jgi:hypothetical protein
MWVDVRSFFLFDEFLLCFFYCCDPFLVTHALECLTFLVYDWVYITPLVFTAVSNVQSIVLHLVLAGNRGQVNLV